MTSLLKIFYRECAYERIFKFGQYLVKIMDWSITGDSRHAPI